MIITDQQLKEGIASYLKRVKGSAGPIDLYREAARLGSRFAIAECRLLCLSVNEDAHEAAKAKDATDYVGGYQDAAIDCDESLRELLQSIE